MKTEKPESALGGAGGWTRRDVLRGLGWASAVALGVGGRLVGRDEAAPAGETATPAPAGAARPAPPSLEGPQAGYYRLRIGDLRALALQDGGLRPPANQTPFAIDEPNGSVEGALAEAGLPADHVSMPFNVLLVRIGAELVLIDGGAGEAFGEAAGRLPASLAAAGVAPEQVTAVLLTHAHRDHFGGLVDAGTKAPRFPNARVFVGRKEHDFWMQGAPDLSGMAVPPDATRPFVEAAQATLAVLKDKLELVSGGDRILDGIELMDTPGHTPGHLAAIIGTGDERLLHFADAATHHVMSFAHPEWRFAYDADPALAVETRRKLFERAAAERLRLFGSHMPFPALGWVRKRKEGGGYDFVREPFAVA